MLEVSLCTFSVCAVFTALYYLRDLISVKLHLLQIELTIGGIVNDEQNTTASCLPVNNKRGYMRKIFLQLRNSCIMYQNHLQH